ncbi:uncharacterized protein BP5553_07716 [Venustampulla echinocandica]|uniref:Manganese/iron superoxide dismutase C-terminal domain-containing protein n=1 Tax=Venustampulla echinocandica TaxID=2656787 RepID=A0A370THC2_9HELO|nr:uncharacterized protein BP5553_07716 [Venustampulla echinocandica]RDL34588.1 hypothetical protein BP5553_07716 [Venustampulla echinocandica]
MLRPSIPRIGRSLNTFRRSLHHVPLLPHNFQNGVPGLLSPAAFDISWTQYQSLMVEKLNVLTAGGEWESRTPKEILLKYARDPNSAPIFNYASMAHNNAFFFNCLSPKPAAMPKILKEELTASFSSIETLKQEFIVTASSMFGPGFVWLVMGRDRRFSLLTTYLAGSPYPGAHYRKQNVDMNTEDKSVSEHMRRINRGPPANSVGAFGAYSGNQSLAPGAADVLPVLCINTWEHVYLPDYGVGAFGGGGKKAYAESWWNAIDWDVVANNAGPSPGRGGI